MDSQIFQCFTSGSPSTDKKNIMMMLLIQNEFSNVILSDNSTKLLDLFKLLLDEYKFRGFLSDLEDVNIVIPLDSSIWPGYSLLHLCVILQENDENNIDLPKTDSTNEQNKEAMYHKRIKLCLERGCSVSTKSANGQTPIHLAFSSFRKDVVKELLRHSETNVIDVNGLSHLHIACILGNIEAVKKYVRSGADVNSRLTRSFNWPTRRLATPENMRANSTPLHLAVEFGNKAVVEYLLKHNADVYVQDTLGFTPIHLVMSSNSSDLIRMLFKATPNLQDSVSSLGLSHLHVATWAEDHEAVDKLLLNGAQVDRVIKADAKRIPFLEHCAGQTPLFLTNTDATARTLLKAGADMNAKDLEGVSALQHALRDTNCKPTDYFIRMLKEGKGDVESCGVTLLHVACGEGDVEWFKRLIDEGADVNARINDVENPFDGATPLHLVLEQADELRFVETPKFVDMVELLLNRGADVTLERNGSTPLHLIFEHYNSGDSSFRFNSRLFLSRVVDLMLRSLKTCNVNPVNYQGFSHFHLICAKDDVEKARQFLHNGVDVNAAMNAAVPESCGFSPLHFAMAHRSKRVAYLLMRKGANVNARDKFGNTPLHVAVREKFLDFPLFEVMIKQGADVLAKNKDGESFLYLLWKDDDWAL